MKTLYILRHASSAQHAPDGTDFARPLTALGELEASIQGGFLREAGLVPDLIVASAALRAMDTAELLRDSLGSGPRITKERVLYNADGAALLDYVRSLAEPTRSILLVAHMPGVADLLSLVVGEAEERSVAFSPGTLAGVLFAGADRWSEVEVRTGFLQWAIPPLLLR